VQVTEFDYKNSGIVIKIVFIKWNIEHQEIGSCSKNIESPSASYTDVVAEKAPTTSV
jgi:hypothetical protein